MILSKLYTEFFESERASGFLLMGAAVVALLFANAPFGPQWLHFWHLKLGEFPIEWWINDVLMTVFFLLVGLEVEREIYIGELSSLRNALLPFFAALGGMLVPAAIHLSLNAGTDTVAGAGIPTATDIAFSLGVLSLLGSRIPGMLKVFLTALAIIDDLGAILVIAFLYSTGIETMWLIGAAGIFILMLILNRLRIIILSPYLILGAALWYAMHQSGIHATLAGVLTAFAIPFGDGGEKSPSWQLQHVLHKPVAFFIIPLFALANAGIVISPVLIATLADPNGLGIMLGLVAGKPLGILLFCYTAIKLRVASMPEELDWYSITGAGLLAGIGFTMSIFISILAFDGPLVDSSKIAVFSASIISAVLGFLWLARKKPAEG